jgi:hypothetical protein
VLYQLSYTPKAFIFNDLASVLVEQSGFCPPICPLDADFLSRRTQIRHCSVDRLGASILQLLKEMRIG